VLYRLVLSELFSCRLDSEGYAFLATYPNMVKWWINQKIEPNQTFSAFRHQHYRNWRNHWKGYNSQHAQTSSTLAYTTLKSLKEQPMDMVLQNSFAVVSSCIVKIEDEKLIFPTIHSKKVHIQLNPKISTQKTLLEQAQNMYWQLGQIYLTPEFCVISFTHFTDVTKEKDPIIQKLLK